MKKLFIISSIAMLASIVFACTGNSSANNKDDKQNAASDPASGSTGGSGNDMFYEYKLTTSSKGINIQSDTKMYISNKGNMRVEMDMANSFKGNTTSVPVVIIAQVDKPNESISIDDSAKTYSINHFNDSDFNTGEKIKTISVAKVGEEKILGYNSVHARVITEKSIGSFYNDVDTLDIWKSNDVPFLTVVKDLFQKFEAKTGNMMYSPDAVNQLKQMGCDGFLTKMEIHSKRSSTVQQLVKVEHQDLSANMFQVPAGYAETKE